jgi:hypothetical protein
VVAPHFDDPAVLAAVNEIAPLTTGLSRKIWQTLVVVIRSDPDIPATPLLGPPASAPAPPPA